MSAGTTASAAAFGAALAELRALEGQLAAVEALGDEAERERMQRVCDLVRLL